MTPAERAQVIAALETGREAVTHMLWDHRLPELREAIAIMRGSAQPTNPWREAVIDRLAICCMDAPQDEAPASILRRIIEWEVAVALDPAVSAEAQALIAMGGAPALKED